MFELSFIKKYLTPKRKQLSVSLIALLSIVVITLVVWLIVVFLSVTEGIEKTWVQKLTALNAPLRLEPTNAYFSSYYYNVDRYSNASHYLSKTLGQKAKALISDPYDPEIDESLDPHIAKAECDGQGKVRDLVKETMKALEEVGKEIPGFAFQDVEISGALLRLDLIRQENGAVRPAEIQSQLTSVSYLTSFSEKNPSLHELLLPPNEEDLNHLLFLANRAGDKEKKETLLQHAHIEKLRTSSDLWRMPFDLLPEKVPFTAKAYIHKGQISHLIIPEEAENASAIVEKRGSYLFYKDDVEIPIDQETPLFSQGNLEFSVQEEGKDFFGIKGKLQNHTIMGKVAFEGLKAAKATFQRNFSTLPKNKPLWPFLLQNHIPHLPYSEKEVGILMAKNFRENGVLVGDSGYLAYSAPSLTGTKEMQIPVYVAGFYDPGIMAVGHKCILVPSHVTETINASESAFTLEKSQANQIFVWFSHFSEARKIKGVLLQKLEESGLANYWKVETFHEYEFAKDLMQQFQSDKYLFTMIGILILLVACTNIISLLVLLVTDKKKEIGILRAMGAKRRSIAVIFALCGGSLGFFSCLLGVLFAFFTLKNIDQVVGLLSFIQGHEAFNAQFFGTSLPHEISPRALLFAAIATPLLALIAGLFPAIKAARLRPCESLRSE